MSEAERYEVVVLGSGTGGNLVARTMGKEGKRTAVVEPKLIGGSCVNVACLPTKNVIHTAKVASLFGLHQEFGIRTGAIVVNMAGVYARKRSMVDEMVKVHLDRHHASGDELILGDGRFIGPRTIKVALRDGGERALTADRVFVNVGTHATVPDIPGRRDAMPMTHVEALELQRVPEHLIVLGGGYVGLELGQAMRRFGSRVTLIERGPQLASCEDSDVAQAILQLFRDEGIDVLLHTQVLNVTGASGERIAMKFQNERGTRTIEGTDILAALGRTPNTQGTGLKKAGIEVTEKKHVRVNDRLEKTAPNVWAIGECAGSPYFTHVSEDDFNIIHANLNGGHRSTRDRLIPYCVFTDPRLRALASMSHRLEKTISPVPLHPCQWMPSGGHGLFPRGVGFMKVVVDAQTDRILGFAAFGPEAGNSWVRFRMQCWEDNRIRS